jgi:sialate O-acetylesterase
MWEVELPAVSASREPRKMVIAGERKTLALENILVGDVWILGGQSNMEFALEKVDDGMLEIASAHFPEIRLLTIPQGAGFDSVRSFERLHEWSDWSSRHFRKGDWEVCSPETVREFSAIGYVFGRRLHMATRVPIGLIDASRGGTTVEAWTPEPVLQKIAGPETRGKLQEWREKIAAYDPQADLEKRIANYERRKKAAEEKGEPFRGGSEPPADLRPGPKADQNRPGYCYASMIKPLEGLAVTGAIFHQGYNNCFDGSAGALMYRQIFGEMIMAWRTAFEDPAMPFGILSLCSAGEPQTEDNFLVPMNDVGPMIREAQYETFRDFRKAGDEAIGFASTYDFRKSWYHPQIKVPAGERIAKWALVSKYRLLDGAGAEESWLPPSIEKVERKDGSLVLTMSTNITRKDDSDTKMKGFAIAGEDRRFFPAEIAYATDGVDGRNRPRQVKNVLVLRSPHVSDPRHYRYAWARNPLANLTNQRQIPLATQRSDDWLNEETPLLFPGAAEEENQRRLRSMIRKEMELLEDERLIKEAEARIAGMKETFRKEKEAWEKTKAQEREKRATQ